MSAGQKRYLDVGRYEVKVDSRVYSSRKLADAKRSGPLRVEEALMGRGGMVGDGGVALPKMPWRSASHNLNTVQWPARPIAEVAAAAWDAGDEG